MNTCVVSFRIKRITRVCSEPSACPLHVPPPRAPSACPLAPPCRLATVLSFRLKQLMVLGKRVTSHHPAVRGEASGAPAGSCHGDAAPSLGQSWAAFSRGVCGPVWGHRRARDTQGLPWSGRPAGLSCVACDVPAETRSERTGASLSSAPQVTAPARALHGAPAWPPACERDTLRRRRHQGGVGS